MLYLNVVSFANQLTLVSQVAAQFTSFYKVDNKVIKSLAPMKNRYISRHKAIIFSIKTLSIKV